MILYLLTYHPENTLLSSLRSDWWLRGAWNRKCPAIIYGSSNTPLLWTNVSSEIIYRQESIRYEVRSLALHRDYFSYSLVRLLQKRATWHASPITDIAWHEYRIRSIYTATNPNINQLTTNSWHTSSCSSSSITTTTSDLTTKTTIQVLRVIVVRGSSLLSTLCQGLEGFKILKISII